MIRLAVLVLSLMITGSAAAQAAHSLKLLQGDDIGINPRYLLQDPNGRSVTSEEFRGRFQLIAFGYTYCPDVCPTTLVEMAAILKQLGEQAKHVQPIFISVDPARDSGKVLKTYTEFFDPRILGLTGSPAFVKRAADNFKMRYAKVIEPGKDSKNYAVDHSAGMIFIGPNGEFIKKFAFNTPALDIAGEIAQAIEQQ